MNYWYWSSWFTLGQWWRAGGKEIIAGIAISTWLLPSIIQSLKCLDGHASAQFILWSAVEMRPTEVQNQVCQGSKVIGVASYHWRLQMFVNVSRGARHYDPSVGIVIKTSSICQGTHMGFAG